MKIAIIADPNRKSKDEPLIKEAEAKFDVALYAPITQIRFDITKKETGVKGTAVKMNGQEISKFDCVLAVPTITYSELFYTALWMLDDCDCAKPFDANRYLLFMNTELLRNFLRSNGIPVREFITVASNVSLDKVSESIPFPVIARPPNKKVLVTNMQTLKDVISLYKAGTPILIDRPVKSDMNIWTFVVGEEVVAAYREPLKSEQGKKPESIAADADLKRLAVKIKKKIGCEYCAIRFLHTGGRWIMDRITLSPDFANFQKITGINVASHVISSMLESSEKVKKAWYRRFEYFFKPRTRAQRL